RLRKGAPWLKTTLVQCAVSASNKKEQLFQGAVPAPQEPSRRAESFLRGRRIVADRDLSHAQGRYEVPGSRKGSLRQAPGPGQGQPPPRPTRQARLSGRSPAPHDRRLTPANLHGTTRFFVAQRALEWA